MSKSPGVDPTPPQGPTNEGARAGTTHDVEVKSGADDIAANVSPQIIETQRAVELSPDTAFRITAALPSRFVVVAGPVESGKTTLLASVYEQFLRAPSFAGYCFAGSETLLGFEQRCHLSRQASGGKVADTERTRRVEKVSLLHLRLRREDLSQGSRDLLFTDVSGEIFREAKDSTEFCRSLTYLSRADRVVLLIDGDRLLDSQTRFVAIAGAKDFLRRSRDADMLGPNTVVDILFTKWDRIDALSADARDSVAAHVSHAEEDLRNYFHARFGAMNFARIAARSDPPSALPQAYGIADILPAWIERAGLYGSGVGVKTPKLHREIDRMLVGDGV